MYTRNKAKQNAHVDDIFKHIINTDFLIAKE